MAACLSLTAYLPYSFSPLNLSFANSLHHTKRKVTLSKSPVASYLLSQPITVHILTKFFSSVLYLFFLLHSSSFFFFQLLKPYIYFFLLSIIIFFWNTTIQVYIHFRLWSLYPLCNILQPTNFEFHTISFSLTPIILIKILTLSPCASSSPQTHSVTHHAITSPARLSTPAILPWSPSASPPPGEPSDV